MYFYCTKLHFFSKNIDSFFLDGILSALNPSHLTVVLTFNMDIHGGWGGNASSSVNGSMLTLNWYSAPSNAEISVQVQGNDIKKLECTGASYSNN